MVQHSVIIEYGPYESCHTVKHTENRLEGLICEFGLLCCAAKAEKASKAQA